MEQVYYVIAAVVYAVFIIRFILSWVVGDFDVDADADLDISDVVSFKGLTHFLMGASGWLSVKSLTTHHVMWYDYLIAFALGVVFVIILFFVYKVMMTLETKPDVLSGRSLVGHTGKVYLVNGTDSEYTKYVITVDNNVGTQEYVARSGNAYSVGDMVKIQDYSDGYYII